jgi:transposase-like protein
MAARKGNKTALGNNGGRPTKYDPAYCEAIVEHMKDGASITSFAAEIGVARSSINEWIDSHYEFSEAVKRGKARCAAWWEKIGRKNAELGGGNATLVIFGLKNMAAEDWRDRQEIEHTGKDGGPIETREVSTRDRAKAIALLLRRGLKANGED